MDKPCRSLELNQAKYELALIESTNAPGVVRPGLWLLLTDGCSEGDVLSIGLGAGTHGGLEVELSVRNGKPMLVVYDYRNLPPEGTLNRPCDDDVTAAWDAATDCPALEIDLETMTVQTIGPDERAVKAAEILKAIQEPAT